MYPPKRELSTQTATNEFNQEAKQFQANWMYRGNEKEGSGRRERGIFRHRVSVSHLGINLAAHRHSRRQSGSKELTSPSDAVAKTLKQSRRKCSNALRGICHVVWSRAKLAWNVHKSICISFLTPMYVCISLSNIYFFITSSFSFLSFYIFLYVRVCKVIDRILENLR